MVSYRTLGEETISRFPRSPHLYAIAEKAYIQGENTRAEEYALMKLKDVGITQTVEDIPIELLAHLFVSHCAMANHHQIKTCLTPKQLLDSFMNSYISNYLYCTPSDRGQLAMW